MTNPTELLPCPKGWRLVPVEPTEDMLGAWASSDKHEDWRKDCTAGWSAMLSAAPAPVASEEVERVDSLRDVEANFRAFVESGTSHDIVMSRSSARLLADDLADALSLTTPARAVSREEVAAAIRAAQALATCCVAQGCYSHDEIAEMARATRPTFDAALALIGG